MPNEVTKVDRVPCEPVWSAHPELALLAGKYAGLSWPLIVGGLVYLFVLAVRHPLLSDPDTYWHVAAGRWMIDHAAIFTTDPFSHTVAGAAWMAHEWLSEIIFAIAYQAGGWGGLVVLTGLAFAASLAILTRFLLKYLEPVHALVFVGLAMAMALPHIVARPFVLAMPLMVLWVAKLVEARDRQTTPSLWLLPLMTLWANMFGGFTIGIAFCFAFAAEAVLAARSKQEKSKAVRSWAIFAALAVASALITPNGIQGFVLTLSVFNGENLIEHIGEWQSPNFHKFQPLELWLLAGLAVALHTGMRLPPVRLLLLLGLVHLALWYARSGELLGLLAPLILAAPLAAQWYPRADADQPSTRLDWIFRGLARPAKFGTVVIFIGCLSLITVIVAGSGTLQPRNNISPVAAVEAARKGHLEGPVFNDYDFGGYLIHAGIPTFIDGRSEMFGKVFVREYLDSMRSRDSLQNLLEKYRIDWTLLRPGSSQVEVLTHLPEWQRYYVDNVAVIHVRKKPLRTK
jgi:hypothetical protein